MSDNERKIPKRKIYSKKPINNISDLDDIINNVDVFTVNQLKQGVKLLAIKLKEILHKEQYCG